MASNVPRNALDVLAELKEIIQEQEQTISHQAEKIRQLEEENLLLRESKPPTTPVKSSSQPELPDSEQSTQECNSNHVEDRRHARTGSLASLPRRSSSFHRKHLEEPDVRTRTESYELSSDLFDKQIEALRNKYGGAESSERAARVIQEAYRRYRMRLNFRKIRKSKTRRLTVENKIHVEEKDDENPNVEVVELVLGQSFEKDDTMQVRQTTDEDHTPEATADADQEEKFDKLFDENAKKSEELLIAKELPENHVESNEGSGFPSDLLPDMSGVILGTSSVRKRRKKRHGYETVVLPGDKGVKEREKENQGDDDDTGTLKRRQDVGDDSSMQSRLSDGDSESTLQFREWPRVGSNMSLVSNDNDEESLKSSDTASITSGQSEFSNNITPEGYQRRSTLSTRGSWHVDSKNDIMRKRLYRIGLNLFNKKPDKGIEFLVDHNFIARTAPAVATFLLNRKGLSRQMVGEFLGNTQKRFNQETLDAVCELMDFSGMEIDEALRDFQRQVKVQGEAQKVDRLVEAFSQRYCTCNPKFVESLKNPDAIFILAFAIIMLNTDLHSPNMKREKRMTEEDFIKNLRGIDGGNDLDSQMLHNIYSRIRDEELKTGEDHVTQVLNVEKNIMGKKPVLAVPHRRLVCYCRLYQVTDPAKPQKIGLHQRAVFLFNDLLLITKVVQRKRNSTTYGFKLSIPLQGMNVLLFETTYYLFGIRLINTMDNKVLVTFNAPNEHDRNKFVTDLRESINEVQQMENYRIGAELERAQLPTDGRGSLTRDNKALSVSMHNLNDMRGPHDSAPPFVGMDRPASVYSLPQDMPNSNNNNLKVSESKKPDSPLSILEASKDRPISRSDQSIFSSFRIGKKNPPFSQAAGLPKEQLRSNGKPPITLGCSNV